MRHAWDEHCERILRVQHDLVSSACHFHVPGSIHAGNMPGFQRFRDPAAISPFAFTAPIHEQHHAAYLTRRSWKYDLTRWGSISSCCSEVRPKLISSPAASPRGWHIIIHDRYRARSVLQALSHTADIDHNGRLCRWILLQLAVHSVKSSYQVRGNNVCWATGSQNAALFHGDEVVSVTTSVDEIMDNHDYSSMLTRQLSYTLEDFDGMTDIQRGGGLIQ